MNNTDNLKTVMSNGKKGIQEENYKESFLKTLEKYENRQVPIEKLCRSMARHFNNADILDRQELVVHLFSSDPIIQSLMASNFARFNKSGSDITDFDQGAIEKSLLMARHHIKMGEFSLMTAPNWLSTIGYLGQKRDVSILLEWCRKICEGEMKDSKQIQKLSLLSINRLLEKYPESASENDHKALAKVLILGIDSQSPRVQKLALDLLLKHSDSQIFTETFISLLSGLPRTDRTARFLGLIAGFISGSDETKDDFIGMILERSLDGADDQYITGVLKEITMPGPDNSIRFQDESIDRITDLLEEYFEAFLYTRKEKNQFKALEQKEKFNRMIKFFHPQYSVTT